MKEDSPCLFASYKKSAILMLCSACALLLAACNAPSGEVRHGNSPGPQSSAAEQSAEPALEADPQFLNLARQADAVVVGQLVRADFSAEDQDGFLTTTDWTVLESVRGGPQVPGNVVRVRFPLGQEADGDWNWNAHEPAISPDENARMKPGDTFLLMLSRTTYEEQSRAKGGQPLPGVTGVGLGFHRLKQREIQASGWFRPPPTIDALIAALKEK